MSETNVSISLYGLAVWYEDGVEPPESETHAALMDASGAVGYSDENGPGGGWVYFFLSPGFREAATELPDNDEVAACGELMEPVLFDFG